MPRKLPPDSLPAPLFPVTPRVPLREWALIHIELLWIYDRRVRSEYLNQYVTPERAENRAWLIRKGSVRVTSASGTVYEGRPGQWLFPPHETFQQQFTPDATMLSLNFHCGWPSGENLLAGREGVIVESTQYPALEHRARQLEQMVRLRFPGVEIHYYDRFAGCDDFLSLHTLFLEFVRVWLGMQEDAGATFTRQSTGDDRVLRAIRRLNSAPLSGGFPRDDLFRDTGLSESHLNRLFFKEHRATLRGCWEARRLTAARRCLETSQMQIKEIAYSLGFSSTAHFITWFRKRTHQCPTAHRKTHRTSSP